MNLGLWRTLLINSVALLMGLSGGAIANELPSTAALADIAEVADLDSDKTESPMAQVTSISQLTDIKPTDWAFQALTSLVKRSGCIVGYPNQTFKGNQSLTRYEFAAGVNACLNKINELIAASTNNLAAQADLATLQRLQTEFAPELATLRGRVDSLDSRTTILEKQQFSTTTKLNGLVFFSLTGAFAGDGVKAEAVSLAGPSSSRLAFRNPATGKPFVQVVDDDPGITLSSLAWLTLTTSFTGKDALTTVLAAGNADSPANVFTSAGFYNSFGVPLLDQSNSPNVGTPDVNILELSYLFSAGESLQFVVGPRLNWDRYFDNNRFTSIINGAGGFNAYRNPLFNSINRGAGAIALWQPSQKLRLIVGYLGESNEFLPSNIFNSASNPSQGLFNGTNTLTTELAYAPSPNFNLRLLYNRTNIQSIFGQIGGAIGGPIQGYADDGAGGPLGNATADTFAINFDWLITPKVGVFGRYGYASTDIGVGKINAQAFQVGLALPNLGRRGAQATLSFVAPFDVLKGREFLISGGGDGGMQSEIEATYFLPLSYNFAVVPSFYMISNPNNFGDNPTIFVGHLRTMFSF